jgi:WD40 repeat protein
VLGVLILPVLLQLLIDPALIRRYAVPAWIVTISGIALWIVLTVRSGIDKVIEDVGQDLGLLKPSPGASLLGPPRLPPDLHFIGRSEEQQRLCRYMQNSQSIVVSVNGLPGVGKTTLVAATIESRLLGDAKVLWLSLKWTASFDEFCVVVAEKLADSNSVLSPPSTGSVLEILRVRILGASGLVLVVDNVELALDADGAAYKREFAQFSTFIEWVTDSAAITLILIGSIPLPDQGWLTASKTSFVVENVSGLSLSDSRTLLADSGVRGESGQLDDLVAKCGSLPLTMKLAAAEAKEYFDGSVLDYLNSGTSAVFYSVVQRQFSHLTEVERLVMAWLAIEMASVDGGELGTACLPGMTAAEARRALYALRGKALVEHDGDRFYLLDSVAVYVIDHVVNQLIEELEEVQPIQYLGRLCLQRPGVRSSVAKFQVQNILAVVVLLAFRGQDAAYGRLADSIKSISQQDLSMFHEYLLGNLLCLLNFMGADTNVIDLTDRLISNVDLRSVSLRGVDAQRAEFKMCKFGEQMGLLLHMAMAPRRNVLLVGTTEYEARAWNGEFIPLWSLRGHEDWVRRVAVSENETYIATGTDEGTVRLWEFETGRLLSVMSGPGGKVAGLIFVGQIELVCAWESGHIRRLQILDKGERLSWPPDTALNATVLTLSLSSEKSLIAVGCHEGKILLVDEMTLGIMIELPTRGHAVQTISFAGLKDDYLISGGSNGGLIVWDLSQVVVVHTLQHYGPSIWSVSCNKMGKMLAVGDDLGVKLWELTVDDWSASRLLFEDLVGRVRVVIIDQESSRVLVAAEERQLLSLDIITGEADGHISGVSGNAWVAIFDPRNETIIVGMGDGRIVRMAHIEGRWIEASQKGDDASGVWCLTVSADRKMLASASRSSVIQVRDIESLDSIVTLSGHEGWVKDVIFGNDPSQLFSSSEDGTIREWDTMAGREVRRFAGHGGWIRSIVLTPRSDKLISACDDGKIRCWSLGPGTEDWSVVGHQGWVWVVDVASDETILSAGEDGFVRRWNPEDGVKLQSVRAHSKRIRSLAVSPRGGWFATASDDLSAALWSESGELMFRLEGHQGLVRSVAFAASGERLVTASFDGCARVWDVVSGQLIDEIRIPRLYEGLNVREATGISPGERAVLERLGAVI